MKLYLYPIKLRVTLRDWILNRKAIEDKALKGIYYLCRVNCQEWLQKEFKCSPEDAEDIFQMSILILYDNVVNGKLQVLTSNVNTYLLGIAKNKALELMRKRKYYISDEILSNVLTYITSEEPDVKEEQLNLAWQSLDELGDPCKSILIQYYYNDKSMEEITSMMNYKNTDTTKNQKYKCLKRLQSIYYNHKLKTLEN